jgi:hypothetical protein
LRSTARRAPLAVGSLAGPGLAALLAAILAAPSFLQPLTLTMYDAGITASSGTFILNGQLPYRDFWLLYGPLAGYISAGLTWLTGPDVRVLNLAGYVVVMLTAVIGQRLVATRVGPLPSAVVAACAATIPLVVVGLGLSSWSLAMMLGLAAIAAARHPGRRSDVVVGSLIVLAILARLDLGCYAAIAVLIAFRRTRPLVVAAVVLVPIALWFAAVVPWPALYEQLIWYPIVGPRLYRAIPAPSVWPMTQDTMLMSWLLYWGPLAIIAATIIVRIRGRRMSSAETALLILAILCRLQTLGRADDWHSAQAAVPALLLIGYLAAGSHRVTVRMALGAGACLLVALAGLSFLWLEAPFDAYGAVLRSASEVIHDHTDAGEPIFVGETTSRYALANPLIGYYLADRPAGVRDTMYNPGVTTTEATQRRIVADLEANDVRYLMLDRRWSGCYETSNQSQVPGSTLLDTAIERDYRVVADFGAIVIMARRDVDVPPIEPGVHLARTPPNDNGVMRCRDEQP